MLHQAHFFLEMYNMLKIYKTLIILDITKTSSNNCLLLVGKIFQFNFTYTFANYCWQGSTKYYMMLIGAHKKDKWETKKSPYSLRSHKSVMHITYWKKILVLVLQCQQLPHLKRLRTHSSMLYFYSKVS